MAEHSVGLQHELGAPDYTEIADTIRRLAADPVDRTLYRIFWPLQYQDDEELTSIYNKLVSAAQEVSTYVAQELRCPDVRSANDNELDGETFDNMLMQGLQRLATILWLRYNQSKDAATAAFVVQVFAALFETYAFTEALASCLRGDNEDQHRCTIIVSQAIGKARDLLVRQMIEDSVKLWQAGKRTDAINLINTSLDTDVGTGSFNSLYILGDSVLKDISQSTLTAKELLTNEKSWPPTIMVDFQGLINATKNVAISKARLWQDGMDTVTRNLATKLRNEAIDLANDKKDYAGARVVLKSLLAWDLPKELAKLIGEDRSRLKEIAAEAMIWSGIKPVSRPPSLYTLNGIGCKLYGRSEFPGKPGWYYATYYFVILFLPIFPICQYIVSDAPGRGWYFHATAPLNKGHKIHMGISLALILLFVFFCANSSTSTSDSQASSSSGYTSPQPASVAGPDPSVTNPVSSAGSGSVPNPPSQNSAEITRLQSEYDTVTNKLTDMKPNLDDRASSLDRERASIDLQRQQLDAEANQINTDRPTVNQYDQSAIDTFNTRVQQLRSDNESFNQSVRSFNRKLERLRSDQQAYNALVDKQHEIASKLQKLGGQE